MPPRHALIALVNAPFSVALFDRSGRRLSTVTPKLPGGIVEGARFRSIGAMPLDCGTVLQVLTDLTSTDRVLFLYQLDDVGLQQIRSEVIAKPIGVITSNPSVRTLLGVSEEKGFPEILILEWSWTAPD